MDQEEFAGLTERYLQNVEGDWQSLPIAVDGKDRSIPLEQVFFMLQARRRPRLFP